MTRIKKPLSELVGMQLDPNSPTPMNIFELRNFIYYGFHDEVLRSKYWKVLLNYYSTNKFKSDSFYTKARQSYHEILVSQNDRNKKFKALLDADMARTSLVTDKFKEYKIPVENILLKYAATNSTIGYVQGMIYLIVPLYHVMITSENLEDRKYAEEDTFYLFYNLMGDFYEAMCEIFDDAPEGIKNKIKEIYQIVKEKDPKLYKTMFEKELLNTAFPIKWILQLFTNCYELKDILYLWDKIFSDAYRFEILSYCCAARILFHRTEILKKDFCHCMKLFENPCKIPVEKLFLLADELRRTNVPAKELLELKKFK